jgi:YfiH family protein
MSAGICDTRAMANSPRLERERNNGLDLLVDPQARARGVLVAFAARSGGVSSGPFATLNLSGSVGDDPDRVSINRARVAAAASFDLKAVALARQVHGREVIEVGSGDSGVRGRADGLTTRAEGPVLGIFTADCAPVVIEGDGCIGIVHAGWRGLVSGVVEAGVAALPGAERAWIGPCIHACCYEVGPEVVAAFERVSLPVAAHRRVDPARAAAAALRRAGVAEVAMADDCTHCSESEGSPRYFSHRRDGRTGRQGSFIGLGNGHIR